MLRQRHMNRIEPELSGAILISTGLHPNKQAILVRA